MRHCIIFWRKKGIYEKVYQISLVGCDDETVFKMELTDEEYKLLKKVGDKANATATYNCMPRMYVEEIKK